MAATLTAGVLHLVWALYLATEGGDLAAQAAWTDFAWKHPDAAYSFAWYGGMHPASYSVMSPYLMALFGIRTVAVVTGTLSAALTGYLLKQFRAPVALPASLWAAFALSCNSASGRVTFSLGLTFALMAAIVAFTPRGTPALRAAGMVGLSLLASLASPVAGLFLLVLAGALFLTGRRRAGICVAVGLPVVVGTTSLLFPFSGVQPISFLAIVLPATASVVAILTCAPKNWAFIRVGAGVYLAGILMTWLIPSPVGSNVERLSLLFGGMFLLSAVARAHGRVRIAVLSLAFIVTASWQVVKPVDDLIHTEPAGAAADHARSLISELDALGADDSRIEVVPLRSHWESSGLSRQFTLARGWNRQVDAERHGLFYKEGALTSGSYRDWLHEWAVQYVVLPEQEVDWSAQDEAALVGGGQPYLTEIWRDEHWRLYRVARPTPLVDAPAFVHNLNSGELVVDMPSKGSVLVRIAWSPWLSATGGDACLARAGDFVRLEAHTPGRYTIAARYGLHRGNHCGS
ncbi:MFS transporter [Actinomadura darangshiensis]|uniref:MFS transporter n=1 Tax=Actinomadura darangshiensis TaxID=705336 RepID=A0A4R5BZ09_9ACTN|nr:MFS transporter [Actinomadura darangshiensis]TDD90690.1 MFS transporter [Actinomadura darangshiensis]